MPHPTAGRYPDSMVNVGVIGAGNSKGRASAKSTAQPYRLHARFGTATQILMVPIVMHSPSEATLSSDEEGSSHR